MEIVRAILSAAAVLALAGCATYSDSTANMRSDFRAGNFAAAAGDASRQCKEAEGSGDELIWLLETGSPARAANMLSESSNAFERAEKLFLKYDAEGGAGIGDEAAAAVLNQTYLPYTGYNYDRIMAAAYQALNLIELKNFEEAEVWLKKLENFQSDAEAKNRRRIDSQMAALEKAQSENGKKNYDVGRTLANSSVRGKLAEYYGADFLSPNAAVLAKGVYTNPFAYWLAGLYFSNRPADMSDKSRAADFFRLANQSCEGGNKVAALDALRAEALANGSAPDMGNFTYAIFESGMAPIRRQFRIDLPLYVFGETLPFVGLNFPYLLPSQYKPLPPKFSGGGKNADFFKIADMDSIISREFKNELPLVITRTVLSAAVKAGAQFAAQYAVRRNSLALLAVVITGTAYQLITNDADLRTWTTLPKSIYIAKLPTPPDGIVEIGGRKVSVDTKGLCVIVAKQISPTAPLFVRKFNFKQK